MEFVALDVETANADMASICQIGIAQFRDGSLVEDWNPVQRQSRRVWRTGRRTWTRRTISMRSISPSTV